MGTVSAMTRTPAFILIGSALALGAGACGSDDKPAPSKPAATPAAATAPYGTYTRQVTKADLERTNDMRNATGQEAGSHQVLPPTGQYRLVVAKSDVGDVIKVIDPGDAAIDMYVVAGEGVLNLDDYVDPSKGAFCGPEVPVRASYRFQASGEDLQIQASPADDCADRDSLLGGTWKKG